MRLGLDRTGRNEKARRAGRARSLTVTDLRSTLSTVVQAVYLECQVVREPRLSIVVFGQVERWVLLVATPRSDQVDPAPLLHYIPTMFRARQDMAKKRMRKSHMSPDDFRSARDRMELNQEQLAAKLGVHVNTVQNYEADRTSIPFLIAEFMRKNS